MLSTLSLVALKSLFGLSHLDSSKRRSLKLKDILVISLNHISTQIISILNIILKSKVWFHQSVCSITKSVVLLLSFSS